jgi:prolyl-tRNA synthetase
MRQSKLFSKTNKSAPKDEESVNAQLLIRGGYIDKLMAGIYSYLPLGFRTCKKIEKIIREEINAVDGQEIFMPSMHPKENWEKTGRWDTLDVLVKVGLGEEKNMALAPTHEEVVAPLAKKIIESYKDLPRAVYHFQNKFRGEKRAKSGILRLREFIMKDLYSFHSNQEDLDRYYDRVAKAYKNIFERVGIGEKTYFTYASGGTFSKYSHEFQAETEAGEDTIYVCEKCHIAINKEIIEDLERKCPVCGNDNLRETKAVEVGNIFKLGIKYSVPFNLMYKDQNGEDRPIIMGCYGIGPQRLMGTIVEIFHDEKGIIWPEAVAPFRVHLLGLGKDITVAEELYQKLKVEKIEVLFDDREVSAGEKFADADLLGLPYRIIISEKSLASGGVELKKRNKTDGRIVKIEELLSMLKQGLQ